MSGIAVQQIFGLLYCRRISAGVMLTCFHRLFIGVSGKSFPLQRMAIGDDRWRWFCLLIWNPLWFLWKSPIKLIVHWKTHAMKQNAGSVLSRSSLSCCFFFLQRFWITSLPYIASRCYIQYQPKLYSLLNFPPKIRWKWSLEVQIFVDEIRNLWFGQVYTRVLLAAANFYRWNLIRK